MKRPADVEEAIAGYRAFSRFEPREIGTFRGLVIPMHIRCAGPATHVLYRSDKWEGKNHNYIHEHDEGPHVYVCTDDIAGGKMVPVPAAVRRAKALYLLGACLGFGFVGRDSGEIEAECTNPFPNLYATPDKKHLLIIDVSGPRAKLEAMIWGPGMSVEPEGITG